MKEEKKILIVDDNKAVTVALKLLLKNRYSQVDVLTNPNSIPSKLRNMSYDVIILDMNFVSGINTGNEGLFWLNEILKYDKDASIIFITAYADLERAVEAIHLGAADYVEKPWDDEKLLNSINKAIERRDARKEINQLKSKQSHLTKNIHEQYKLVKGASSAMKHVYNTVSKVAATDANVLLLGENGTGKEVIAREIHFQSNRKNELFINVDMAALNVSLFESEMFGHIKGAFTDANQDRVGRFELAHKGTLFLDEIGNLPIDQQSKLLVALQNREISPVGASYNKPVDIRLISATNKNLEEMIAQSTFREDLYYRMNTVTLQIPPLRERKEDIPALVDFFINKYQSQYPNMVVDDIRFPLEKFSNYDWPGNIRELQHTVEKFLILGDIDGWTINKSPQNILESKDLNLEHHEILLIKSALAKTKNKYQDAAKELGISRRTLYNKMKKYGI